MKHSLLINDETCKTFVFLFEDEGMEELKDQLRSLPANFVLLSVEDWNRDLSPWPFKLGKMEFAGEAEETARQLSGIYDEVLQTHHFEKAYIGGYSLAGLFALYCEEKFDGVISCSSSLWFKDFVQKFEDRKIDGHMRFYLSLGKREELSRNQVMQTVGDKTRELYRWLKDNGNDCILEMNEGGHFDQPLERVLKGIRWILGDR